jgi:hypothetical protein
VAIGLIDNILVEAIEAGPERPEIEAISLSNSMVLIEFTGAAADTLEAFQLLGAAQVAGPYSAEAGATFQTLSPGRFRADLPATGPVRFFQIAR